MTTPITLQTRITLSDDNVLGAIAANLEAFEALKRETGVELKVSKHSIRKTALQTLETHGPGYFATQNPGPDQIKAATPIFIDLFGREPSPFVEGVPDEVDED